MADVFISYSRRDSEFVRRLQGDLESRGKDVWVDVEGIRDAEVFPAALRRAIEGSDAFVFVISPESVRSAFCEQEINHALELNKRVVPLALREVAEEEIPEEIRFRNWIHAGDGEFARVVDRVVAAVETDLDWERQHTRMTVKALEWDQSGRDRSFLLRGSELAAAERWLAAGAGKGPGPSALEQAYLLAARAAATRRQRVLVAASLGVAVVSIGLLVFALISRGQAISARNTAKSRALAAESQTQLSVDPERAVLLASAAARTSPTPEALFALRAALDASPIRYRLPDAGDQGCSAGFNTTRAPAPGVAFNPDGRELAEGLCGGSVVLADARTGRVLRRVNVGAPAGNVTYNRDGSLLATYAAGRIEVLDPASGRIVARGPGRPGASRLIFSPAGPVLALSGAGGVMLWNLTTRQSRVLRFPAGVHVPPSTGLTFSPDGRRLAVGLRPLGDPTQPGALIYDLSSGGVVAKTETEVDDLAFSPDGRRIAAAASTPAGAIVAILDARHLALRRTLLRLPSDAGSGAIAISPDGSRVAFGFGDGTAGLRSADTGRSIAAYLGQTAYISQVAFSPDGRLVATASHDGTLRVWRAGGLELAAVPVHATISIDLRPAGSGFVTLTGNGPPLTGDIRAQSWPNLHARPQPPLVIAPTQNIDTAFLSQDGRLAGVIPNPSGPKQEAPIRVWNVPQRRLAGTIPPSPAPQGGSALPVFSPDGRLIATANPVRAPHPAAPPGALLVIDTRTGRFRVISTQACGVGWAAYAFTRNSKLLAAGTICGQVSVWNLATGRRLAKPLSIHGQLSAVAVSPEATSVAAGSGNSTITVADVRTGRVSGVLAEHTGAVNDVAYSPDGRFLASASSDDTVRIWDAHRLTLLRVLRHSEPVYRVAFTADSRRVLSYDNANVVHVWDACTACGDAKALLATARARVTRQLAPRERKTFGVG